MSRPIGSMGCSNLPENWRRLWYALQPARAVYQAQARSVAAWSAKQAKMTPEQLAAFKARRNDYDRARRSQHAAQVASYTPSHTDALDNIVNEIKADRAARKTSSPVVAALCANGGPFTIGAAGE